MDILYLSSLCSVREYERMFTKYGTTSSHASQKFNRMMVQGLVENGCHVETISQRIVANIDKDDLIVDPEIEDSVKFVYLPRKMNRIYNRIATIWNAYRKIIRWHKEHPKGIIMCDIILGELALAVCMAKKRKKIFSIAIVTDVPVVRAGERRKGLRALPFKLKNATIFKFDSYVFLTEQMNDLLNPQNKPYVIIEGLADKTVLELPNELEKKYQEKVCIMAGLLENIYGVDILLKAFEQVVCPGARLRFYGKGSSVNAIIEAGKIDSRISFCGELTNKEIVQEEKKATLLINPRPPIGEWTAYSFPSKNMEYMASGTPLVACDLPCIPEEYKKYFYRITPPDESGLKNILQQLLEMNREELHEFGLNAQQWIVEKRGTKIQTRKICKMVEGDCKWKK